MELNVLHLGNPVTRQFRQRHLHGQIGDARLALAVERLFDEFFELEWLFDHRYGGAGAVLASAAAALLRRQGWPARVAACACEVKKGGRMFHIGVKDWAARETSSGHAVCVVGDELLVDFALADVRRNFDRGFPWGIAVPLRAGDDDGLAAMDIAGHGRVRWSEPLAALPAPQAMKADALLARLLLEHAQVFGAALG